MGDRRYRLAVTFQADDLAGTQKQQWRRQDSPSYARHGGRGQSDFGAADDDEEAPLVLDAPPSDLAPSVFALSDLAPSVLAAGLSEDALDDEEDFSESRAFLRDSDG